MTAHRFFWGTGRVQVGANRRAVDEDFFEVSIGSHHLEQTLPDTVLVPAGKPHVSRMPASKFWRQITPRCAGAQQPQDGLDEQAVIRCGDTFVPEFAGQVVLDPLPRVVPQNLPSHLPISSMSWADSLNFNVNVA